MKPSSLALLQKAKEADLHRLADALLEYETLTAAEIRQARQPDSLALVVKGNPTKTLRR